MAQSKLTLTGCLMDREPFAQMHRRLSLRDWQATFSAGRWKQLQAVVRRNAGVVMTSGALKAHSAGKWVSGWLLIASRSTMFALVKGNL